MERERENSGEKRRRKIIQRPILVRSVKPGAANIVTYTQETRPSPIWKAA